MGVKYAFKAVTTEEYEATIHLHTGARIIKKLFEKTKKKLIKKTGKDIISADYTIIKEFSIPPDMENIFFPVVDKATSKIQKEIIKNVKIDGIKVLSMGVKGVVYQLLENGGWLIIVTLGGIYVDERK